MKIAFLSRYQNTIQRGGETFVSELAKQLSKNHQVDILSGKDADNITKIIKGNYNIVIPLNGGIQALKASIGRLFGRYKLVIAGESGIGRDDLWNIIVCKPDAFVALTEKAYKWAKRRAWGSIVVKIPNGVDLEKFNSTGEKLKINLPGRIILSVGALEWYKFHEKTINAMSFVDNASLLIVGRGSLKERLKKKGKEVLDERFKLLEIEYSSMPNVYRTADIFVLPSWDREAFGIVYLEALSSNIPVVAPDDENRKEIIGDAGVLTNTDSPQKYAEAIERALESSWKDKPRQQAEKFSWDKIAKKYEELFYQLLKK